MRDQKVSDTRHADAKSSAEDLSRHVSRLISSRNVHGHKPTDPSLSDFSGIDDSVNTMKLVKTDDLIERLCQRLKEQGVSDSPDGRSVHEGRLSGAIGPLPSRRAGSEGTLARPASARRKKKELVRISKHASRTESLLTIAESLGIDMSKAATEVSRAKASIGKKAILKAKQQLAGADRSAHSALVQNFPQLIGIAASQLRQLEKCGAKVEPMRRLLGRAKNAHKKRAYFESVLTLRETRKRIQQAENDAILRIIVDSKGRFLTAKRLGLNIDEATALLTKSRDELKRGEFTKAVIEARQGRKIVDGLLQKHKEARIPLLECIKAIRLAEVLGSDVSEMNRLLSEAKQLFKQNDLERSKECSSRLLMLAMQEAHSKASESYGLAEKALTLAKGTVADLPESEEKLKKSRELLERNELARSVSMACASMVESDSAIANSLADRLRKIDDFAKGIERDVDSLTEVQDAIETSRERNLENLRKYASLAEHIVGEAYESAAAYARVAQDIVKQAYDRSSQVEGVKDMMTRNGEGLELSAEVNSPEKSQFSEKRQRLVDLYLRGKVSEGQLDKLLLMIDSSIAKDNLV